MKRNKYNNKTKLFIIKRIEKGENINDIANEFDRSVSTINKWIKERQLRREKKVKSIILCKILYNVSPVSH
ncbi:helix-turn-helix domain-containing protein [Ruoffia tabacinasalis]|uniref:Helix-turn-helix domain-containing protein n=1 Tax=Ruoffia tabacinasalis TaxID=87458 RepID=A0ABS0LL75_9LACT|nr:helix-turn-helix domain-containing protein [Ruoffia tabacinasalis]MBG9978984.1 helix-turn-helix domain-containing protein [Ruoffia tabacinasalis]